MTIVSQFVAQHLNHVSAFLIIVSLVGACRATRALAQMRSWCQYLLIIWLAVLVTVTYMVPGAGVFGVGVVVPLFADGHVRASLAAAAGQEAYLRSSLELLRKRGVLAFALIASIAPLLNAGMALVLIAISRGNLWASALGEGMLASALLAILNYSVFAARYHKRADQPSQGAGAV